MNFTRPTFVAAVVLALGAPAVWAVEGDIVFERKARPETPAPSAEENAKGESESQPATDVEKQPPKGDSGKPAEAGSKEPDRTPGKDAISSSETKFYAPATFPHWTHIIRYRCFVCHPRIYPMKAGPTPVFGVENHKEKSCGRCHNGRNAFNASFKACGRCHISQEKQ